MFAHALLTKKEGKANKYEEKNENLPSRKLNEHNILVIIS